MAKRWYIVHAYSNFEKKVAESIKEQAAQKGLADQFEHVPHRRLEAGFGGGLGPGQPGNGHGALRVKLRWPIWNPGAREKVPARRFRGPPPGLS